MPFDPTVTVTDGAVDPLRVDVYEVLVVVPGVVCSEDVIPVLSLLGVTAAAAISIVCTAPSDK